MAPGQPIDAADLARISALQELQRTESRAASIRASEAAAVKDAIAADQDKKKAVDAGAAAYASLADQIARRMSLAQALESRSYAALYARITAQVVPAFSDAVIADARRQMESERLYLPPEARA